MTNRLASEASPYLQQHADNPVDWYPWGAEAFSEAQRQRKPILLSVGYAACHWCHVMAHESFEDSETAALMNEHFINVKVDREERPDVDSIYMNAVVALTGQGGWPMTVILTPDGEPFYGGTYFPPAPRYGMPSFRQVLESVARAWQNQRDEILSSAEQISGQLSQMAAVVASGALPEESTLKEAVYNLQRQFDATWGGFGGAPKFPQPMILEFLLRYHVREGDPFALHMAERTLEMMAKGGMYDQLGGGFARYSTDVEWLVPHFEKMLYDNALLSSVYLHAYRLTNRPLYRRIVEETLDWVVAEMSHAQGGFFSSLDADSEGEEGKFYVWDIEEVRQALNEDADIFIRYYGLTPQGNWEGHNILRVNRDIEELVQDLGLSAEEIKEGLQRSRRKLYALRAERIWPGLDDKVITAWNGLMLKAFAEAGRDLARPDYLEVAVKNAEFLHEHMRQEDGRLHRSWMEGHGAKLNGYLEDYAYLAEGLLTLYQSTFDEAWYAWGKECVDLILKHFGDEERGGFFDTSDDHEALIYRPKDIQDNAIPSGGAATTGALLLMGLFSGEAVYWDAAQSALSSVSEVLEKHPTGFAHWLCASEMLLGDPVEIAIVGDRNAPDTNRMIEAAFESYRPNQVVAVGMDDSEIPLLNGRTALDNQATAYVCRQFVCRTPVTDPTELEKLLP